MSKLLNIKDYQPASNDIFFFDNNIWMFLFGPIVNNRKKQQQQYSDFFKAVKSVGSGIWINSLVLSEFCNAWLRIEFSKWKRSVGYGDYKKDFVGTQDYLETIDEIKQTIPQILNFTEKATDNFNAISLDNVFDELESCDFNDSYYLELARMNSWKIVTDDADLFKNNKLNIDIITANIR